PCPRNETGGGGGRRRGTTRHTAQSANHGANGLTSSGRAVNVAAGMREQPPAVSPTAPYTEERILAGGPLITTRRTRGPARASARGRSSARTVATPSRPA